MLPSFSVISTSLQFKALLCFDSSLLLRPPDCSTCYLIPMVPDLFLTFTSEEVSTLENWNEEYMPLSLNEVSMTAERRATESGVFRIFYSLADLTLLAIGNPLLENQLGCSHQLLALHRSTCCLHQHKQTECQHLDLKSYRCTVVQRLSTRNTLTCIPSILKNMYP